MVDTQISRHQIPRTSRRSSRLFGASRLLIPGLLLLAVTASGAGSGVENEPKPSRTGQLNNWTDERCNGCHRVEKMFSHPVGIVPNMHIPDSLPLQRGRLTCLTCHDGSDAEAHAQARANHTPMLREGLNSVSICSQCHRESSLSAGLPHATAQDKAHLAWPGNHPKSQDLNHGRQLDQASANCVGCHDGALTSGIGSHNAGSRLTAGGSGEHPVGVPYAQRISAEHRAKIARMVHPDALDDRIRLFEGNIGCGSCHSVYSQLPYQLVMSNQGSRLCLSCHDD